MFRPIGSLIGKLGERTGAGDSLVALRIRQIAKEAVSRVCRDFGEDTLANIKITTFKKGVLTVVAPAIVCGELHMRSGELVEYVNKKVGEKVLRTIKFKAS